MTNTVDPGAWRRVFVRMPNWVGDVVMATPALRAIRQAAPQAEIVVGLKDYVKGVLENAPNVDRMIIVDAFGGGVRGRWRLSRRLRKEGFDAAILLTNSFGTAVPVWLAGIPVRSGYIGEARSFMLTHKVKPEMSGGQRRPIPMPDFYQRPLDAVGIEFAGSEYAVPPTDDERAQMTQLLERLGRDPNKKLIALNPGAAFGASKLWPLDRFGALAAQLEREGAQVLLLAGPGEDALAAQVRAHAGPGLLDTSRDVVPLGPLRALIEAADLLVSTDSGPRHLAVAAGTPVVVLIGPTFPEWTACNLEHSIVLRHEVPCGPCHLKTCPEDHACMNLITIDEVASAVRQLIERPHSTT